MTMIMACGAMFAAMPLVAETQVVDGITWTYTINDYRQAIVGAGPEKTAIPKSTSGIIVIPAKLGGCPVVGIDDCAFLDCSRITRITIHDSVTSVDERAFDRCSRLKSFSVKAGNPSFKSVSGLLLTKDGKELVAGVNGNVKLPAGVTTIGSHAFAGLENLTGVDIPSSVTCIRDYAFNDCYGLVSVTIPSNVASIEKSAFAGCIALENATIGNGVWTIGDSVFWSCKSITDVYCYADPLDLEWGDASDDFLGSKSTKIHVSAAHFSAYKRRFGSKVNATFVGDLDSFLTVTFNANGGKVAEAERKVKKNYTVGKLPAATKKGYKHKGWYTAKSGGTKIMTSTKVTENVTYYAQWKANKYVIKFNKNGGSGTMKKQSATYGKAVTLRANAFKKRGYKFKGWAKTKKGKVAYKNKAKVKNLTTVNDRVVTLYAVWKRAK